MKEGSSYYAHLWEYEIDTTYTPAYLLAMDEMVDYYMQDFCFGIMPVRDDGMVEYYHKMIPGGKLLPYEWNIGAVWAELPQKEFEENFTMLIKQYETLE